MFTFSDTGTQGKNCMPNILETARQNADLSLAIIMFQRAGLEDIFNCPGPFTVQFPTNAAIEQVDASLLDFLLQPENQEELRNLMLYHILPGLVKTAALVPGPLPTLFDGRPVNVGLNPTTFNDATVITADVPACNGLINMIDRVLTFLPGRK
jgi:uncharacterized surface protein with fasciclin (FAS1) repeats